MLSRRGFIVASGTAAFAASGSASAAEMAGLETSVSAIDMPQLSRTDFQGLVGQRFFGVNDSGAFNLLLEAVEAGTESPGTEQFALRFKASSSALTEGCYDIAYHINGRLHGQTLFLTELEDAHGAVAGSHHYAAAFSLEKNHV